MNPEMRKTAVKFALLVAGIGLATGAAAAENKVRFEGTLEVQVEDDFKAGKSRTRRLLKTDSGKRYELRFRKQRPRDAAGGRIRVHGSVSGSTLYLESGGDSSSYAYTAAVASGLSSLGEQKTAVLLVNFQDQPANKPATVEQWSAFFFGSGSGTVNGYFLEASYQLTWFTGNVHGWFTIAMNSTDVCDTGRIQSLADAAASAAGVNLSSFSRLIYAFPYNTCSWAGLANVGAIPSRAFINGGMSLRVVAHEVGHNLGMSHSHSNDCDLSPVGEACAYREYGDVLDLMGAESGHSNAFQKERMGWLNHEISPPITTVQSSGTYSIDPIESAGTRPKALKILKSTDPATGVKTWYYVEFRQPLGADSYFSASSVYYPNNRFGGVIVHTGKEGDGNSSYMLDMTPGSLSAYSGQDLGDPALTVGQTYADPAAGMTISVSSVSSSAALVNVTLGATGSCIRSRPSVVVSPASQSVAVGAGANFAITVTNQDSTACEPSTFNLMGNNLQNYLNLSISPSQVALSPGASASATLTVSPKGSTNASLDLIVRAISNSSAPLTGSASARLVMGTGGELCIPADPFVTVTPRAQGALAGSTLMYTAFVTSRDSSGCAARNYPLQINVPYGSGLTASVAPSITLDPGAAGSVTLSVTSPGGAATQGHMLSLSVGGSSYDNFWYYVGTVNIACNQISSVLLTPSLQSSDAGGTVTYSMNVWNTERSACGSSTFSLSASVPAGFSASFGTSSVTLAPGAWTSVPVRVTSPVTALTDLYAIKVTASAGANPTSASATYVVLSSSGGSPGPFPSPSPSPSPSPAPSPSPTTGTLSVAVSTDKAVYAKGATVYLAANVSSSGAAAAGASVSFKITRPDGSIVNLSSSADASGSATAKYRLGRKAVAGAYRIDASASFGGKSGTGSANFSVQ